MPAGRSSAAALLQKVNSQLRGERVPLKTKEEDELASYLNSLTVKTQQARSANFEDYGDISISSGADAKNSLTPRSRRSASPANSAATPAASKFLKKKKVPESVAAPQSGNEEKGILKTTIGNQPGNVEAGRNQAASAGSGKGTSALDKVAALTNKIKGHASRPALRRHQSGDSESEGSLRGSETGQRPRSADMSVGRDGHKFLKSRRPGNEEDRLAVRSPSPQLQRSLSHEKKRKKSGNKSKGEIIRTLGNVYVTSDEESLAEFIQGLSASESSVRRPQNLVAKKQQKWRRTPSQGSRHSPSPVQRSRSPSPFKAGPSPLGKLSRSQSQDSDMLDSMASEIMEEKHGRRGSMSSEDHFKLNLMDVASLLPESPSPPPAKTSFKKNSQQKKRKSSSNLQALPKDIFRPQGQEKKKCKKEKASSKKSESSLFETLGIHMVDELIDINADNFRNREMELSDDSEIKTEKSDDRRRAWQRHESESEIITELGSGQKKVTPYRPHSSAVSISERIGVSSAVVQEKRDYGDTDVEDYSESFLSDSETITTTESQKSKDKNRWEIPKSKDDSQKQRSRDHKIVMEEKKLDISTTDAAGATHHWNATHTGMHVLGPYGLQYVDPTPVATHVISADALEAMTAYSPNVMALQEMMKAQLDLVKNFVDIQTRIYQSCMDGLKYDFKYTTLEDTKEYIAKNSRPRLTFEEALKLVEQEEEVRA